MLRDSGVSLLQAVAQRIVARYLVDAGYAEVHVLNNEFSSNAAASVDLSYRYQGRTVRAKVKPDVYFGTDPAKVRNRDFAFYRSDAGHYAFESIANHMTREAGWMFSSEADELFYYYLVIAQPEEEIRALLGEPDDVFFGELKVERDELRILPMAATRTWFEEHYEEYTPRPVMVGDVSAWYRLIPRSDIDTQVPGIRNAGAIFTLVGS